MSLNHILGSTLKTILVIFDFVDISLQLCNFLVDHFVKFLLRLHHVCESSFSIMFQRIFVSDGDFKIFDLV